MRAGIVGLLSGGIVLCGGRCAWAQAGRFVPRPIPNGGGGSHLPHFHIPFFDSVFPVIALVVGVVVALAILASVGYHLGYALGGGGKRSREGQWGWQAQGSASPWWQPGTSAPRDVGLTGPATGAASAWVEPDQRDLILNPAEVAAKAARTTLLMEFLAHQ